MSLTAFTVKGVEIRVQGKVRASPGQDVIANYDGFYTPSDETITLPNVTWGTDCFALRVDGPSMARLGIMDGDFLVVERQDSLWWPSPQDVIIARYLPHNSSRGLHEESDSNDPESYLGPVVKVYLQRFGERGCELGWQHDNESNPFIIQADHLMPIAKVRGVYRDVSTILPMKR